MAGAQIEVVPIELQLLQATDSLAARLEAAFSPRVASNSSRGKLVVALNLSGLAGRTYVEVWVKSSGAASFIFQGSRDGREETFRPVDTIALAGAGERHEGYFNAYPVVRVYTEAAGDNEIEIVASR